ncbi:hypothetical protein F4820DRAFT_434138 [Hypoxylon rubiginosum]|uniref:Uncharacterized protein n=1 Tax=Hypoxylon rubiginosum TaxID=110542 RepID=A0ACB9YQU9_9PEZI|nr:hypothetical protein F4820DRAFT_434138 [Hypoxylon rubiginosum]
MVRFVESDSTGLPLKRKQVAQACARCRRRKKRCFHNCDDRANGNSHSAGDTARPTSGNGDLTSRTPTDPPTPPLPRFESLPESTASQTREEHASRFVGDLSPEAILMEATSLCSTRDVSVRGGLGIWQPRAALQLAKSSSALAVTFPSRHAVQDMLRAYVWSHCLACCPPPSDYAVLRRIYLEKLDPIFPIIGGQLLNSPNDEIEEKVLQQIVSLAAAPDPEATRHLRLTPEGALLSRHDFCTSLSNSIQTIIDAGLFADRIFLIRTLAALSLYMQPSCPDEADVPALLNGRAVHQMHTIGLQMASEDSHTNSQETRSLFCCLWALDRITGAFYGRACLIHERDVGWDVNECIAAQAPPFRLFLMIVGLLDKVIGLYRPGNRQENDIVIELPIFEQMILDAGAARVSSACLASLEIFYHSVAILSSQSPSENRSTALPAPATNSRRSLAADRITSIVGQEYLGQLSYLPIIPYGVSLSLSVSYRKMRHSNVPMFRSRGNG